MKKAIALLLVLLMAVSLFSCGFDFNDALSKLEEMLPEETEEQEESTDESTADTEAKEPEETEKDEDEYDPAAWITDNLSISFYMTYYEDSDSNELMTLKIYGDKAVMFSKIGDDETRPETIYEETDEGLVQTTLIQYGESKSAVQMLPKEGKNFENALPYVLVVGGTFGCRVDSDPLKGLEKDGKEEYIGRDCDVYVKKNITGNSAVYIDRETGIVLLSKAETIIGEDKTTYYGCYVTEFEYGNVTAEDVEVDLSEYKMSYEEAEN